MLVLTRQPGERIQIGENIVIEVLEVRGNQSKIGIEAPARGEGAAGGTGGTSRAFRRSLSRLRLESLEATPKDKTTSHSVLVQFFLRPRDADTM